MPNETVLQLEIPGVKKLKSGKVREIFDLGDRFLFVASDRISVFDVIMPNGIPRKGEVLTQISYFWFAQTESFQPNHLISKAGEPLPSNLQPFADKLAQRSMIVKKAKPLAIECVVRGYLAGSGWKEYKERQSVSENSFSSTRSLHRILRDFGRPTNISPAKANPASTNNLSAITSKHLIGIKLLPARCCRRMWLPKRLRSTLKHTSD